MSIVVRADRMEVRPRNWFIAWVAGDDSLWRHMRAQRMVTVIGSYEGDMYVGKGVPDQISGAGVRIVGEAHKAGWIEKPLVKLAARALERKG